ncbi:MAG: hypothetical protein ACXV3V_09880 [Actinomycetes bacterium]
MTGTQDQRDQRQKDITAVVLKFLGIAVAIGLAIGIGAWVLVKAAGLDTSGSTGSVDTGVQPVTPLPTTALPVPSSSAGTLTDLPTVTPVSGDLNLTAAPVFVKPMERINLTGTWPGHDNQSLLVQRYEGGSWSDFGVQVNVNVGTFETYVMTGRPGDQRFRVFDPTSQTASNDVTVTVG